MRREMKEAIQAEDYERASKLRDEIRRVEETPS
ncbi:MAG TPA: UvrB/UvrC motif-containing protein [Pirellulales bacterium]|nr:UvrB/UvrC motif-containing protein [Pirellulales bacterium]